MALQGLFMIGLILLFYTQPTIAESTPNPPEVDTNSCSYPVSGAYGPLPRYLFYISLIFAIVGRRHLWLVVGALASAMLFSSSTVVHAVVIVAQGVSLQSLDLDLLAILAFLLPSLGLLGLMMDWSKVLEKSRARPLVRLWGLVVWIGLIVCLTGIWRLSDGIDFVRKHQAEQLPTLNCALSRSRIRGPEEILAALLTIFVGRLLNGINIITLFVIIFGTIGLLVDTKWASGGTNYSSIPRHVPGTGFMSPKQAAGLANILLCAVGVSTIPSVVLMELLLWNIPNGEAPTAIGQWGPLVLAAFAIAASLIDHYFLNDEKPKTKDVELGNVSSTTPVFPRSPLNDHLV